MDDPQRVVGNMDIMNKPITVIERNFIHIADNNTITHKYTINTLQFPDRTQEYWDFLRNNNAWLSHYASRALTLKFKNEPEMIRNLIQKYCNTIVIRRTIIVYRSDSRNILYSIGKLYDITISPLGEYISIFMFIILPANSRNYVNNIYEGAETEFSAIEYDHYLYKQ